MKTLTLFICGSLLLQPLLLADELMDAVQAIHEVEEAGKNPSQTLDHSPWNRFKQELDDFQTTASSLSPEQSAKQWTSLVREWPAIANGNSYEDRQASGFTSLLEVLPPPEVWSPIEKNFRDVPFADPLFASLADLFSATLLNDNEAQWTAFHNFHQVDETSAVWKSLNRVMGKAEASRQLTQISSSLLESLIQLSDNPDRILAALEWQLAQLQNMPAQEHATLRIPDLVSLVGEAKTRTFFETALKAPVELSISGNSTQKIAREVALNQIQDLQNPQWELVSTLDVSSQQLYEALVKKFGTGDSSNYRYQEAFSVYLLCLLTQDEIAKAKKVLLTHESPAQFGLPYSLTQTLLANGYGKTFFKFLTGVLTENPDFAIWSDYLKVAAQEHQTAAAVELAQKSLKRKNLDPAQRRQLLAQLSAAHLAHGEIEPGIALQQEEIRLFESASPPDYSEISSRALDLAALARLLGKNDLLDKSLTQALSAQKMGRSDSLLEPLVKQLILSGRATDAQNLVLANLKRKVAEFQKQPYGYSDFTTDLLSLAGIYESSGQSADVLVLLTQAPWWGANDLSDLVARRDFRGIPLGVIAARAFIAAGDSDSARNALETTLRQSARTDAAYQMLVDLDGAAAIPFLDNLFQRDPFEERPLIWKAVLLYRAKQWDEAEKVIRQAISIDPSDGEMGEGDRMRAYAVLADILEAKDNSADAQIYRNAVQAIRLSEEADQYQRVGLLAEAVKRYEAALRVFSDAYCIQSRLAIQLMNLGETQKAEAHYLKAYELMPDSFGRVESHCFGCERAFAGKLAESLAEKTFKKLLEAQPNKPQLHYLLGYLRDEQERYGEALASFQKAVELDPDYLNAWKKILTIGEQIAIPPKLRDEAILAELRLDPFSTHGRAELSKVSDLKKLWGELEALHAKFPPPSKLDFFALTASQEFLEKSNRTHDSPRRFDAYSTNVDGTLPSAQQAIASQEIIRQVTEMFNQFKAMSQLP